MIISASTLICQPWWKIYQFLIVSSNNWMKIHNFKNIRTHLDSEQSRPTESHFSSCSLHTLLLNSSHKMVGSLCLGAVKNQAKHCNAKTLVHVLVFWCKYNIYYNTCKYKHCNAKTSFFVYGILIYRQHCKTEFNS